ncbi:MAG: pucL [Verrucomicrobia bacterium]|nr:pucL [Verrucomicrobiota bacterium]
MTLAEINSFDRATFTAALGHLFEHSPWVAAETWDKRPFRGAGDLLAKLCATMLAAPAPRQLALIQAHPDLAGRLAREKRLTSDSNQEQASAGLDRLAVAELAEFQRLNAAYRGKFGFPFVICARLNAKSAILAAMQSRLTNDPATEHAAALTEIGKIAGLRLEDLLKA